MTELSLVEQFEGKWENCVVLTYTLSLSFFETWIWRRMSARVRNCVLLADETRYLEELQLAAASGLVRMAGIQYICDGVASPQAHHPKVILLTSETEGRLLVGSGNLTWSGFAGAEQYTRYDYDPEDTSSVNAFIAARELLQGLMDSGFVRPGLGRERVEVLLAQSPWLLGDYRDGNRPVRHNLEQSLLSQFVSEIGGQAVEDLVLMAPFYDPGARGAAEILRALQPAHATLLLQPGRTSVDPRQLQRLQDRFPQVQLCAFEKRSGPEYAHAKFYLARTANRSICLQGSPNLSQVALLRSVPESNVEAANLITGTRAAFDGLLEALDIEPATTAASLNLSLVVDDTPVSLPAWRVTAAEWKGRVLRLRHTGPMPVFEGLELEVGGELFAARVSGVTADWLDLLLADEAIEYLRRAAPLRLTWLEDGRRRESNFVFAADRRALDEMLRTDRRQELIEKFASDGLTEDDFGELLEALEGMLIVDGGSVLALAGARAPSGDGTDPEVAISYDEVDWIGLAAHPRLLQYRQGAGSARLPLQVLLGALARQFSPAGRSGGVPMDAALGLDPDADDALAGLGDDPEATEEQGEITAEESERLARRRAQRIQASINRVCTRYLRGTASAAFLERIGPEIASQNYRLVSQLLAFCLVRGWCEPIWTLTRLAKVWKSFWADQGYLAQLSPEGRERALGALQDIESAQAAMLGISSYGALRTRLDLDKELRFGLRDLWRELVVSGRAVVTSSLVAAASSVTERLDLHLEKDEVLSELRTLLAFETEESFGAALQDWLGDVDGTPSFDTALIWRPARGRESKERRLMLASESAYKSPSRIAEVIARWMAWEGRDYYRVEHPEPDPLRRAFWDVTGSSGVCILGGSMMDLESIESAANPWDALVAPVSAPEGAEPERPKEDVEILAS